ncbi:MAG: hypothetical protein ACRETL_05245 [Gammaproteobacteria bacterium]
MSDEVIEKIVVKNDDVKNLEPEIQVRDAKWRAQAKVLAEENESLKAVLAKEKSDLLGKIDNSTKAQRDLQQKLIGAELKAQAIAAGIIDVDFIKMIDTKNLSLKEDGSVDGLEKAVEDLKSSKPVLFGAAKKFSSSKNSELPNKTVEKRVNAFEMTAAEFQAEKSKLGL